MNAFKDTRVLAEAALAVALSFVLGFIVLFRMPFGGSVSLEMIPLILLALRQGWKVGVVAVLARFLCHFVSGVVFFASYAPEGWNVYLYSAAYNAAYLVPSLAVALIAVVALLRALEAAQPSPRQVRLRRGKTS